MKKRSIFTIICLSLFVLLGIYKEGALINEIDRKLLSGLQTLVPSDIVIQDLVTAIGNPVSYYFLGPIFILIFLKEGDKRGAFTILASILVSTFLMLIMKNIFRLERPFDFMRIDQRGFTYPSGHALVSAGTYFTLYRMRRHISPYKYLVILPFLIALSRATLGVHYPTDILMGLLIGFMVSSWSIYFYRKEDIEDYS